MVFDKRACRRFEPVVGTEKAVLRFKGRDYNVFIKDVSSGGFGIIAEMDCPILCPDQAMLQTDSGWHVVRTAHIQQDSSSLLIGLELIEDVAEDEKPKSTVSWMAGGTPWHYSAGRLLSGTAIVAALVLIGLACSLLYFSGHMISKLTGYLSG